MIDVIEKREKHNTVKNTKGKETQIELLRIIAMILIIIHHYVYHGGILDVHLDGINKFFQCRSDSRSRFSKYRTVCSQPFSC